MAKKWVIELSSEEYGTEIFKFNDEQEAMASLIRLIISSEESYQRDSVQRRVSMVIGMICKECGEPLTDVEGELFDSTGDSECIALKTEDPNLMVISGHIPQEETDDRTASS